MNRIKLGLLVNPFAGLGGSVGLKGSDGERIVEEAVRRGAEPRALQRVRICLQALHPYQQYIEWYCWGGDMGETSLQELGYEHTVVDHPASNVSTTAQDTQQAARSIETIGVDLLVFAGGDGTARDMVTALNTRLPVLGIPAGVKIHSGVYAVHAKGAAEIIIKMIQGDLVNLMDGEVRDIDEAAFRQGQVKTCHYGELLVPAEERYLQHVKCGGKEVEALVLEEIAAGLVEQMEDDVLYILGPGTTTRAIAEVLGLENTLLGIDLILNQQRVQGDASEADILAWLKKYRGKIIVTPIGGQGHILGRGNHQISPPIIHAVGIDNLIVIATKSKLKELQGRPLLVDTWDEALNESLCGFVEVITGYEETVLYSVEG